MKDKIWTVIFLSPSPGVISIPPRLVIEAQTCDEQNGALVFRDGDSLSVKAIVASGTWRIAEIEDEAKNK